jgi:hypothetical protein
MFVNFTCLNPEKISDTQLATMLLENLNNSGTELALITYPDSSDRKLAKIITCYEVYQDLRKDDGDMVATGKLIEIVDKDDVIKAITLLNLRGSDRQNIALFHSLRRILEVSLSAYKISPVAFKQAGEYAYKLLDYREVKECPSAWQEVVDRIDDPKTFELFIGSLLVPGSDRKQYLHIQGDGDDGKSTVVAAVQKFLGARGVAIASAKALTKHSHFGESLEGARLVVFPDENDDSFFSSTEFKNFTGESTFVVNPKGLKERAIRANWKTIVISNNKVQIKDNSADRSRLIPIHFSSPSAKQKADLNWKGMLFEQTEDFMFYCVGRYVHSVFWDLGPALLNRIPVNEDSVHAAIERSHESNIFLQILDSEYSFEERLETSAGTLYRHFNIDPNREKNRQKELMEALKIRGIRKIRKNQGIFFLGLALKEQYS